MNRRVEYNLISRFFLLLHRIIIVLIINYLLSRLLEHCKNIFAHSLSSRFFIFSVADDHHNSISFDIRGGVTMLKQLMWKKNK